MNLHSFTSLASPLKYSLAGLLALSLAACGGGDDVVAASPAPVVTTTVTLSSTMSGDQELPPTLTGALGAGSLSLESPTRALSGSFTVNGMTATAAHIHTGVLGANGPVIFPLSETAAGSGIWVTAADATLTDAQITSLKAGGLYFNAHSTAFPGGEIRGQIGLNVKFASLNATQEVPTNGSTATGTGTLVVNPLTRVASGSITLTGMTATAAHIHLGATGANGAVIVPLVATGTGVFAVPANTVFTADQFKAYKQGNLYYNAHSAAFPGGEIRGQIR